MYEVVKVVSIHSAPSVFGSILSLNINSNLLNCLLSQRPMTGFYCLLGIDGVYAALSRDRSLPSTQLRMTRALEIGLRGPSAMI